MAINRLLKKKKKKKKWKSYAENVHQKLVPNPYFILVNNPKQILMQEILLKIRNFGRAFSKSLKKI